MPGDNVEITTQGYEALSWGGVEEILPLLDPAIVIQEAEHVPGRETLHGHDGMRAWFNKIREAFDELRFEPIEMIEARDQVVAVVRFIGRGRASTASIEGTVVHVWTLRNGTAVRVEGYLDREDALRHIGRLTA